MIDHASRRLAILRPNERGQVAILMVMVLPVIFLLFALAFDAGLWFLDHRMAQNQADAAVLAAVQHLPDADPGPGSPATKAVHKWLKKNGSNPGQLKSCPESIPAPRLVVGSGAGVLRPSSQILPRRPVRYGPRLCPSRIARHLRPAG